MFWFLVFVQYAPHNLVITGLRPSALSAHPIFFFGRSIHYVCCKTNIFITTRPGHHPLTNDGKAFLSDMLLAVFMLEMLQWSETDRFNV